MLSSLVPSVFFVLAFAASTAIAFPPVQFDTFNTSTVVEVIAFDDLDTVLKDSGLIPLSPRSNIRIPVHYTFGNRDPSRDYLVSSGGGYKSSSSPQTFQLHLNYPSYGQGALITYVEIDVEQSSSDGHAYITSGGVKERNIRILVDAKSTTWFKYNFKIYGY
ncbi:uncharacterized protein LOC129905776 [Episyrphus balteatus]|uniref:uncharacterized protein LOC129905776 n=1 Tax=Episyrphus balteatus TaxID=286459 RepID=UPI00248586A7|nr:uncharacterized protein LOC129905776 [Episyrphus balteatus]